MNPMSISEMLTAGGGPSEGEQAAMAQALMGPLMGHLQEAAEANQAVLESLQGVAYHVTFERPQDAGGKAAGKKVRLQVDALAQMDVVQQMVEVEMFGEIGKEPAFLVFQGTPLPPHIMLFNAGIQEGSTVQVVKERPSR